MKNLGIVAFGLFVALQTSAQPGKNLKKEVAPQTFSTAKNQESKKNSSSQKSVGNASTFKPTTPALPKEDTRVVFQLGGKDVTVSEFLAVFNKNNTQKTPPTEQEVRQYLDLYIKFKYKVADAYSRGLDTSEKFINELAGYRSQLAQPYLNDKETTEALLKEAYDRSKKEVRASHILVLCKENASPKDTLEAYKKIMALRDRVLKGEAFDQVAGESSEDPSAKENKGDLGYFSAFKMIYSFEDQCFKTKEGMVSMPFRSEVGYHIILVKGSRPARGEIRVAHIMTMARRGNPDSLIQDAKRRIEEISAQLKNGANFAEMAKKYSDDASTMDRGGELAPFSTGKMVPEFEDAAYALAKDGDVSGIIQTEYGFHIIKRISLSPVPEFEKMKADLQAKINRDARSYRNRDVKISKIKAEYGFFESPAEKKKALAMIDSNFFKETWKKDALKANKSALIRLGDSVYTMEDWGRFIDENQLVSSEGNALEAREQLYKNFVSTLALEYENSQLETKYIDFKNLMREYREGILLFDLSDQMVWGKAVTDTNGLKAYYEKHKMEQQWKDRADVQIFACQSEAIAKKLAKGLKKGKKAVEILMMEANAENALAVKQTSGKLEKGSNPALNAVTWEKGLKPVINLEGVWYVVRINDVIPAGPKELDEVRGIMTSEFQNELELEWLDSLKKKFGLKVNDDVIKTLY
jgi:peptidyl-prolyl cis-trans isomerase SurA